MKHVNKTYCMDEILEYMDKKYPTRKDQPCIGSDVGNFTVVGFGNNPEKPKERGYFLKCLCGGVTFTFKLTSISEGKKTGCSNCKNERISLRGFETFSTKFTKAFHNYELIPDRDKWSKGFVKFICPEHGVEESLTHNLFSLTRRKTPCYSCNEQVRVSLRKTTKEAFITKAKAVHGDLYDYTDTEVTGCLDHIKIYCKSCEKYFYQVQDYHLAGSGCNLENSGGFSKKHKGCVYVSDWGDFLKVGITSTNPYTRLSTQEERSGLKGELLFFTGRISGEDTISLEKDVAKRFTKKVTPKNKFPDGFTECYYKEDLQDIISFLKKREDTLTS